MSGFKHSIVLFTGEDGLPLEFNVRNTIDKADLKALIEFGGGFCTQNENAVHLISPGTKVLNVDTGKKLVSSSYIYDCVKKNYLLDVNDYVFTIAEAQTSDISEENSEDSLIPRHSTCKSPKKITIEKMNFQISPIKSSSKISMETGSTTPSNLTLNSSSSAVGPITNSSSTHSESFVEGTQAENSNVKINSHIYSENKPLEKCKSPEVTRPTSKLFSPFKSYSPQPIISPKKGIRINESAILSSPKGSSPFSCSLKRGFPEKVCDNLVISPKKVTAQFPNESPTLIKSPIKRLEIMSPRKCSPTNIKATLRSPSRCLSFSDNAKEASPIKPMELCDSLLSPKTSPLLISSKKATFSSPSCCLNFSDFAEKPSPIKPIELCDSFLLSQKKSPLLFSNTSPTFTKSPVKTVEVHQNSAKPSSIRESFALRPVNELLRNSTSPTKPENRPPETVSSPDKPFEACKTDSPTHTVVTSSQPEDGLDKFDNMLLSKIQKKPLLQDEDSLSQSFTVSSSADAQVSSKPSSSDVNAPELPKENAADEPDSPSIISSQINVPLYLKNLEEQVEKILRQTPPISIQDKIVMVKYICCVRKLPPATVLSSIFTNSLDL